MGRHEHVSRKLICGGDKLWPAPQGWDGDDQWPGPPDPVLDGQPYMADVLEAGPGEAAVRLTSGKDQRSGIQLSRVVRVFDGSTRVSWLSPYLRVLEKGWKRDIWTDVTEEKIHELWTKPRFLGYAEHLECHFDVSDWDDSTRRITIEVSPLG